MAAKSVKKQPTFEAGLSELEKMADEMERSDLPLEDLMKLYKEGVALSVELAKKLESMKAELQELRMGKNGVAEATAATAAAAQTSMEDLLLKEGDQ